MGAWKLIVRPFMSRNGLDSEILRIHADYCGYVQFVSAGRHEVCSPEGPPDGVR